MMSDGLGSQALCKVCGISSFKKALQGLEIVKFPNSVEDHRASAGDFVCMACEGQLGSNEQVDRAGLAQKTINNIFFISPAPRPPSALATLSLDKQETTHPLGGIMEEANNTPNLDPREAKADAKAAAAKAKALRPWFKKKRFIVPGVFVLLMVFSSLTNGGNQDSGTSSTTSNTDNSSDSSNNTEDSSNNTDSGTEDALPKIGDSVVSGNFTFTVNSMECGISQVGNDTLGQEAQGEYCKINVTVANTGKEADYFAASSQVVLDAEGREFEADTGAMIYLDEGDEVWLGADINPGNSAEVVILYDMPAGVAPVSITLVDGIFSSGVVVSLQ
jgi:hypothetical protein